MRPANAREKVELLSHQIWHEAECKRIRLGLLLEALLSLFCLKWPCLSVSNLQITVEHETGSRDDDQEDDQEDVLGEFANESLGAERLLPYVHVVMRLALLAVDFLRSQDLRRDAVGVDRALVAVARVDALGGHSDVLKILPTPL